MSIRSYSAAVIVVVAVVSVGTSSALPASLQAASTVSGGSGAPSPTAAQAWEDDTRRGAVPIPRSIGTGTTGFSYWVSAVRAAERSGRREESGRLAERYGARFAAARANPSANCLELGPTTGAEGPIPDTLEEAVSLARAVFSGIIIGIDGGFRGGTDPGLLLQVKVSKWIQRRPDYPRARVVYVYYPVGDFQYGDLKICKRDPDWPEPPQVGDEVLLFPILRPVDPDGITVQITGDGAGIAIGGHDGPHATRILTERIPEFRGVAFDELKRAVRREVRRQGGTDR